MLTEKVPFLADTVREIQQLTRETELNLEVLLGWEEGLNFRLTPLTPSLPLKIAIAAHRIRLCILRETNLSKPKMGAVTNENVVLPSFFPFRLSPSSNSERRSKGRNREKLRYIPQTSRVFLTAMSATHAHVKNARFPLLPGSLKSLGVHCRVLSLSGS